MVLIEWVLGNVPGFIAVLCAFGFIIFIHELGHFLTARRVGIRCPSFAIGFGKRIVGFNWRGTEFAIRLLPFGGFVQMLGEDPSSDESGDQFKPVSAYVSDDLFPATRDQIVAALEERGRNIEDPTERRYFEGVLEHVRWSPDRVYTSVKDAEGNFNDRTIPQRMAVVVGGVTMNFISALILFWIVGALWGLVDLTPASVPQVMAVYSGPAEQAGLQKFDTITSVNGTPVETGDEMVKAIERYPGQKISLTFDRSGQPQTVELTPNANVAGVTFHPDRTQNGLPVVVDARAYGDEGPGAKAGLQDGDVITAVNGAPVASVSALVEQFRHLSVEGQARQEQDLKITLDREGKTPVTLEVSPAQAKPVGKIGIMPLTVTEFKFIDDTTAVVEQVAPGSMAAEKGIRPGDRVFFVNDVGVSDRRAMDALLDKAARSGAPVQVDLGRGQDPVTITLEKAPTSSEAMGLTFQPITFGLVAKESVLLIARITWAPVTIVQRLMARSINPELVKNGMSGPIGIMKMIFELSEDGLPKFLFIVALINAAVGGFNLLPFPALDGSRLMFLALGAIRGKELDYRLEAKVHYVGLMVLLALVLVVTAMDIQRIWHGVQLTK